MTALAFVCGVLFGSYFTFLLLKIKSPSKKDEKTSEKYEKPHKKIENHTDERILDTEKAISDEKIRKLITAQQEIRNFYLYDGTEQENPSVIAERIMRGDV